MTILQESVSMLRTGALRSSYIILSMNDNIRVYRFVMPIPKR